jgi:hypothetical protein
VPSKTAIYGRVEIFRVTGSLIKKINKLQKMVFFSDEVVFTLSRNVSSQSNRPQCYLYPLALHAVSVDPKVMEDL